MTGGAIGLGGFVTCDVRVGGVGEWWAGVELVQEEGVPDQ